MQWLYRQVILNAEFYAIKIDIKQIYLFNVAFLITRLGFVSSCVYNTVLIYLDGGRAIVAVGNRVLLYNTETGDLIDSLRGSVRYSIMHSCFMNSKCNYEEKSFIVISL